MDLPRGKTPCKNCPFKKDTLKGWLGKRINEILDAESFVCHKNTDLQCAGHLIIKKDENIYFKTAQEMNIDLKLKNHDSVFESKEDFINHHKN